MCLWWVQVKSLLTLNFWMVAWAAQLRVSRAYMEGIGFITCCFNSSWHGMLGYGVMLSNVLQSVDSPAVYQTLHTAPHPLTFWPVALIQTAALTCCCVTFCVPCPSSCPRCEVLREGHFRDCGGGSDHFSTVREHARWGLSDRRLRKWEVPINVLQFDGCLSYTLATTFLPCPPPVSSFISLSSSTSFPRSVSLFLQRPPNSVYTQDQTWLAQFKPHRTAMIERKSKRRDRHGVCELDLSLSILFSLTVPFKASCARLLAECLPK